MKQEHKKAVYTSIVLSQPRVHGAQPGAVQRFFFYFILLGFGLISAYACFFTTIPVPADMTALTGFGLLLLAAFVGIFLNKKPRVKWLLIMLGVWLAIVLILFDKVAAGAVATINCIIDAYSRNFGVEFIKLPQRFTSMEDRAFSCTLFALCLLFLVELALSWLLVSEKNLFLTFFVTLPFLAIPLVYTIIPNTIAIVALLSFWAFLLLFSPSLRRDKASGKKKKRFQSGGEGAARPLSLLLLPVLMLSLALVGALFPREGYQRPERIDELRSGLINGPDITGLARTGGVGGNTDRVNLSAAGNLKYTGQTMLRVKSSNWDNDYLKGFVGSVYTGQSWEHLSPDAYRELEAVLGEESVQNFPERFSALFSAHYDLSPYELSVRNVGANPRCIYSPYGLVSRKDEVEGAEFSNDGFLKSSNALFGTREYTMRAVTQNFMNAESYFSRMSGYFQEMYKEQALENAGAALTLAITGDNFIRLSDLWVLPPEFDELMSPEQIAFSETAERYARFVYDNYTSLPEGLGDTLREYLQSKNLHISDYYTVEQFANAVVEQVQSENTYTLTPGLTPDGRDFVEYFLFENHRGYCMHFASSTAALLRAAGVPARYAEGYTVSPDDRRGSEGWVDIPDSRAHAWVELYVSGTGWVPLEATPGINGNDVAPPDEPQESSRPPESSSSSPSSAPQSGADDPASAPGGSDSHGGFTARLLIALALTAAAVLVVLLGLLLNRRLRVSARQKSFAQPDTNLAAIAVYGYLQKLLHFLKDVPGVLGKPPQELLELALKARFSQHTLSGGELQKLLDYADEIKEQAQKALPLWRKFILKYIYGLL